MPRALILQHLRSDGPAYLATWLTRQGIPFDCFDSESGDRFPDTLGGWDALAILGGAMSANDPLPSLRQAEVLIREAVAAGKPTLGHCLGGQLMARALGGQVGPSPAPEVGWHTLEVAPADPAHDWLGSPGQLEVFHWHAEAITPPPGAVCLAGNAACPVQAFSLGRHLGMQFHVEVDLAKLQRWFEENDPAYLAAQRRHPTVHGPARMRADTARCLAAQQALADRIYARWWTGVIGSAD